MDVQMPDGTIITGVPDNITQSDLLSRYQGFQPQSSGLASLQSTLPPTSNPLYGLVSRAGSIVGEGIEGIARIAEKAGDKLESLAPISGLTAEQITKERQLEPLFKFAESTKAWARGINYEPSTKLSELASNPLNAIPFIAERVISSAPDMAAAVLAAPAYVTARTNEILNERLKNDDKTLDDATVKDVTMALGGAVLETTLERGATKALLKGKPISGASGAARIAKVTGYQSGTEAAEELTSYLAETVDTKKGVDRQEMLERIAEGAIVGSGLGGSVQGTKEYLDYRNKKKEVVEEPVKKEAEQITEAERTVPPVQEQISVPESESQRTDVMMAELENRPLPAEEAVAEPAPSATKVAEPEDQVQPPQAEPPVPPGMTRLYHGSATSGRVEGPAWFSTNRDYAANYREGAELQYVDVPTDEVNKSLDPDGYGQTVEKGFTWNAELDSTQTGPRKIIGKTPAVASTKPTEADIVPLNEKGEPTEAPKQIAPKEVVDPNIEAQLAAEPPDVESMIPDYPPPPKVEKAPRVKREPTPPRVMYGVDADGNLNVPVLDGGLSFKTKEEAAAAKKLQPGLRVMQTKDEIFLAEKTEKELAADKIKAQRLQQTPDKILSAHEFIASLGGLNKKEASELDPDAAKKNVRVGNKFFYSPKGMTIAEAAEKLREAGYIESENSNEAYQVLQDSFADPVYSINDADAIAEQRFAERDAELAEQSKQKEAADLTEAEDIGRENAEFRDYLVLERELGDPTSTMLEAGYTPAELQEAGFMDASIELQTEVAALQDLATPENIDALDIINSLDTTNQATEEKVNAEEQAIAREVAQAAKSGSRADVGEVNEAKGVAQTVETENISEARGAGSQDRTAFLANTFGKENVLYQDGDLALVLASNIYNDPVYLPVKGRRYLKINLTKDKKPDLLTTPEFNKLIAEKERIEREAQAKHKTNPFIKFKDGIAVSESVSSLSPELADVFAGWKKMLRLNGNIYLTTIEDALANADRFTGPHRRIGASAKKFAQKSLAGLTQIMGNDRYIILDSSVSPEQMLETLAHEMGHAHQQEAFYNAPKDVQEKVQRAYEGWLKKQKGATAQELINALRPFKMATSHKVPMASFQAKEVLKDYDSYWTSFNEWYADNTARWATTSEKPLSVVDKFFSKVAQTLRNFFDAIKAGGFLPNETFKEYMDAITDKESVAANPIAPDDAKGQLPLFAKQAAQQVPKPSIVTAKNVPSWNAPDLTWKDSFIRKIADRNVDLKVVQNEISKQIGNLRDNVNAYQIEDQSHGRIQSQTADFLDYEFRPIIKEMVANNISDAELTKYLWMRHAPEANKVIAERNINNPDKQDGGSGVETEVAKRYMATLPADKKKKLESLAKQVDNILALTREQLEKNGIISKEEREAWESMFENYVPLKREESDYALPTSTYRGVGPFSKSRTGSTSKNVIDILANVAINREIAIMRIEKERVKRAIYGLAVTNPNAGFWKAVSPDAVKNKQQLENELTNMGIDPKEVDNIFSEPKTEYFNKTTGQVESRVDQQKRYADYVLPVKIDGKDRFIFFNPKDERAMMMVTALKGLDTKPLSDFAAAMAPITRWFASVNTQYNLIFGLWNFARDLQGAVFNLTTTPLADKKSEVIKGALSALPELYKEARTRGKGKVPVSMADGSVQDFVAHGGKIGGRERFAEYGKSAELVEKELSKLNRGNVKKAAYATLDWISNVNDMLENAVRLSSYRTALAQGMSKQQAADIAKNITVNFNRKGTVANNVGALYAFFNASVQGTARLAQTVDPRTKRGQKIMASLVGLGVVQAVALAMAGFDEDEPSEFLKQKNLIIPLGNKNYFMWPMPFGFNVFPNIGRLLFEGSSLAIRGKGVKDTVANMGSMLLNSFNPIGGGGVLQGLSPTAADPIVAIYQNRDAFDRPIAKEDQRSAPTPGFTRSRDPSASISQFIAQLLNTASGGTNYSKGLVSPTADQINYLAEQVGGGVYREASRIVRYAGEKVRGDETPEYRVPIVGKLVGSTDSPAAISQKFYSNVVKMSEHEDEIKGRQKDRQSAAQYMKDNPESALWRRANTLENELTKINKRRKELIAKDAPKEQLKRLDDQKTRMMKQFNDAVRNKEGR